MTVCPRSVWFNGMGHLTANRQCSQRKTKDIAEIFVAPDILGLVPRDDLDPMETMSAQQLKKSYIWCTGICLLLQWLFRQVVLLALDLQVYLYHKTSWSSLLMLCLHKTPHVNSIIIKHRHVCLRRTFASPHLFPFPLFQSIAELYDLHLTYLLLHQKESKWVLKNKWWSQSS